jgi:hypothetical protein
MAFDGLFRDVEGSGDFCNAAAVSDAEQNVPLTVGEFFHLGAGKTAEAAAGDDFGAVDEMFREDKLSGGDLCELFAESPHGFFAREESGNAVVCDEVELSVGEPIGEDCYFGFAEPNSEFGEEFTECGHNGAFTDEYSSGTLRADNPKEVLMRRDRQHISEAAVGFEAPCNRFGIETIAVGNNGIAVFPTGVMLGMVGHCLHEELLLVAGMKLAALRVDIREFRLRPCCGQQVGGLIGGKSVVS